jgi:hypothetical protein
MDIEKEIQAFRQVPEFGKYFVDAFTRVKQAIENFGNHLGANDAQTLPPPQPIQQLQVKADGAGNVHAVITDNNAISKNLHYFFEYGTDPAFKQPHVEHIGVGRTVKPFALPAMDDNGNPQVFYARAYSQYQGGHPGPPINFGSQHAPTPISPGGSARMTLLPSTGSGTAQASGQEGGSGFGKVLNRPAIGPKRAAS